jgi:hypothetical protein
MRQKNCAKNVVLHYILLIGTAWTTLSENMEETDLFIYLYFIYLLFIIYLFLI